MLKAILLGTGSSTGVPLIACRCKVCTSSNPKDKRLRSSILIETNNKTFVIDTSADFRQQMITHNVNHLDAIFLTHYHRDHLSGIDDLRAFNFIQKERMQLYCNASTSETLLTQYPFCFNKDSNIPNTLEADIHVINETKKIDIKGEVIRPIKYKHYSIDILGYRIQDLSYITDISAISEQEKEKIKGSKVLIVSALRQQPHLGHFTLSQAIDFANSLSIPKTYFTHMSHQMGLHDTIDKQLPSHMNLAYDGLTFELG